MKPTPFAILALIYCSSAWANGSVAGKATAPGRYELSWPSQVNREYTIMLSTNLVEGYTESATVQSTPPLNIWWEETALPSRFYTISRPAVTNTGGTTSTDINQTVNGDFSSGLTDWLTGTASDGDASFAVVGGECLVDIVNGGTLQWHVFLRQPDLVFSNGTTYTVRFDARAAAARDIQVIFQGDNGAGSNLKSVAVGIGTSMATYEVSHTMSSDPTQFVRLHLGLGTSTNNIWLDNIQVLNTVTTGEAAGTRNVAHEFNRRLGRGNNFMAAKSMGDDGAPEDYALLNHHYFSHCRIGYKMDLVAATNAPHTIPAANMAVLQKMVDWCLSQGLVANVDPVHNWANDTGDAQYDPDDLDKLSNIWVQVATHFAGYDLENVVFEIMNEPHSEDNVAEVIATGLAAIRGVAGNETRMVIVSGDGFSTRQALIDALDKDEIPADDDYLIGTFHYYDPKTFTKSGDTGTVNWGTPSEFSQVATDFDAVLTANTNWAVRNGTEPLPIYLGEFGCDNGVPGADRKKWLSWIRLQAETRSMSWAHWNMYQNTDSSKGMGPWTTAEKNNPELRYFDADPVEALIGRYEFEDGSKGGGVTTASTAAGFTGTGFAVFPAATGPGVWARVDDIYIPDSGTFTVQIHYASAVARTLRLVSNAEEITSQVFPATGSSNSWKTLEIPVSFAAGELAELTVVAEPDEGVQLDWLKITK